MHRAIKGACIVALALAWIVYLGATAYVGWQIYNGRPPDFLAHYTLGTNAAWAMVGLMLWLATEWFRGFRNT